MSIICEICRYNLPLNCDASARMKLFSNKLPIWRFPRGLRTQRDSGVFCYSKADTGGGCNVWLLSGRNDLFWLFSPNRKLTELTILTGLRNLQLFGSKKMSRRQQVQLNQFLLNVSEFALLLVYEYIDTHTHRIWDERYQNQVCFNLFIWVVKSFSVISFI